MKFPWKENKVSFCGPLRQERKLRQTTPEVELLWLWCGGLAAEGLQMPLRWLGLLFTQKPEYQSLSGQEPATAAKD